MIINRQPISIQEAKQFMEKDSEMLAFANQVSEIDFKDAEKMFQELKGLNLIKLREEQIVKVVEFLPENIEDLNRIFAEVTLEEDEAKKIIDVIKKYK